MNAICRWANLSPVISIRSWITLNETFQLIFEFRFGCDGRWGRIFAFIVWFFCFLFFSLLFHSSVAKLNLFLYIKILEINGIFILYGMAYFDSADSEINLKK